MGGKGCGLRQGSSNYNGGYGGDLQRAVGARPTSGGSRKVSQNIANCRKLEVIQEPLPLKPRF